MQLSIQSGAGEIQLWGNSNHPPIFVYVFLPGCRKKNIKEIMFTKSEHDDDFPNGLLKCFI